MTTTAVQASVLFAAIAVSTLSLWWVISNKRKKTFVRVGKVAKLFFYPVKSLKGMEVNSIDCIEKGAQVDGCDDRSYMLVSGDGTLCSQRQEPRMVLLTPSICDGRLHISGPEMETLTLDLKRPISRNDKVIACRLHQEEVFVVDCGDEASAWFQKFLNRPDLRLVYCAQDLKNRHFIKGTPLMNKLRKQTPAFLQDVVPFHVICEESVHDLNSRIGESKVSVHNFRPNVYVQESNAYDEDRWRYIKFSSGAEIVHIIPCGRCILTTNDPETGVKSNKEPLVTLRKYRVPTDKNLIAAAGPSPTFGVHCGLSRKGKITVGDDVYAVVEEEPFKY